MKTSGIYKIVNKVNGKYYVGSSKDMLDPHFGRWYCHKRMLKNNEHNNIHLQRAYNKYGEKNFDFVILEQCAPDRETLLAYEQKYLDIAKNEKNKCYNLGFIAGNVDYTKEVRKKISEANKNRIWKESSKEKLRDKKQGTKHLEATKNKIRDAMIGDKNHFFGKKHSESSKNKISEVRIKNKIGAGRSHPSFDHAIYTFYNKVTGEYYSGTRYDFYSKYDLTASKVTCLVLGIRPNHKKWILVTSEDRSSEYPISHS